MDEERKIKERSNLFIVSNRASGLQNTPNSHRRMAPIKPPLPKDPQTPRVRSSNMFTSRSCDSNFFEPVEKEILLRGIFNHENQTVDVELTDEMIRWKSVKKKQFLNIIYFEKFYSIEPYIAKNNLRKSIKSGDQNNFYSEGFLLHMFEKIRPNTYKTSMLRFEHPHHDTNMQWITEVTKRIPALRNRRKVLVLLNPYCGTKTARSVFNFQVSIYLANAQMEWDLVEFHDNFPLRDAIIQNSVCFEDYYGILLMGGDGSVSNFVNLMLELISKREKTTSLSELKEAIVTPLCIIPIGSTNMLASSLYGTNDICTPLMHLICGNTIRIDLTSTYTDTDKLHSFGFGYACGMGTTLARYLKRYSKLGPNKVQSAITRALAKQRHRPIEVEIKYLKNRLTQPDDENLCTRDCKICMNEVKNLNASKTIDMVQEFDSIANSIEEIEQNLSSTIKYRKCDYEDWEIIRGSFIHIAFLTNSTQWNISSGGGLSKYAHLSDGCLDLVLIDQVTRKDLYRFIKRHANCKNQLSLPFVKSIRIKEAKIKILNAEVSVNSENSYFLTTSDKKENMNYDSDDSEPDLEANVQQPTFSRVGSFKQNKGLAGQNVFFIKNKNGLDVSQSVQVADRSQTGLKKSPSFVNLFKNKKKNSEMLDDTVKRSRKSSLNGEEAISAKCASMWNCDWNLRNIREMHIKCNRRFLLVFGTGLDADTEFEKAGKCFGF